MLTCEKWRTIKHESLILINNTFHIKLRQAGNNLRTVDESEYPWHK